jgi:hypothetical protein
MVDVAYKNTIKGNNFNSATIRVYNNGTLLASMIADPSILTATDTGLTGYFEENTTPQLAASESDADPSWDYTAYTGTARPTLMVVELVDKNGYTSVETFVVTPVVQP